MDSPHGQPPGLETPEMPAIGLKCIKLVTALPSNEIKRKMQKPRTPTAIDLLPLYGRSLQTFCSLQPQPWTCKDGARIPERLVASR